MLFAKIKFSRKLPNLQYYLVCASVWAIIYEIPALAPARLFLLVCLQGFFQQFWEKAPGQNWEKMIDLTSKLGEINDIEHNKDSKIYPQKQVILDCIMPSIPLKHKCLKIKLF